MCWRVGGQVLFVDLGKCQCVGRQDVVQALDPNCRVHIQPRFNQSKKIHTHTGVEEEEVVSCVCAQVKVTHTKKIPK